MSFSTFENETSLLDENNEGYGSQEIPNERDIEISKLVEQWLAEVLAGQVSSLTTLRAQRGTLLAYCERIASLAVRTGERKLLLYALATLGSVWNYGDAKDTLPILSLIYDAALRLGLSADDLFGEAQRLCFGNKPYRDELTGFLRRSAADKSIADMGYIAGIERSGFRYLRNW